MVVVAIIISVVSAVIAAYAAYSSHQTSVAAQVIAKAPLEPILQPELVSTGQHSFEFKIKNVGGGLAQECCFNIDKFTHDEPNKRTLEPGATTNVISVQHDKGQLTDKPPYISASLSCTNIFGDNRYTSITFWIEKDGDSFRVSSLTWGLWLYGRHKKIQPFIED